MLRRHGAGFRALLVVLDVTLAVGVLVVTSALRFGPDLVTQWVPVLPDPLLVVSVYAVGWALALWFNGLYRPRSRWNARSEGRDVLRATALMAISTLAVLFWLRLPDVSRTFLLILFPIQASLTFATRIALRAWFQRLRAGGYNRRFVLVVGGGERARAFADKLTTHRELGLEIVGFLDDEAYPSTTGWTRLGSLEDIERVLRENVVDEVAVCLPFSQWDKVDAIARICEDDGKIVRVPMDVLDRAFASGHVEDLDGTPVYSLVSGPDRLLGLALKRAIDLAAAVVGFVVLSPLLVAIALWIRATDGSPILFRQTRVGLHGRPFDVIKFRTMVADAEERYEEVAALSDIDGPAFKLHDDPRVTRVGRFLRRTSLDELPQLWNVLRGEMSLVGPRPAPQREVQGYDLWHRRRLSMKPGITGLWQVKARRSPDFDERAELDLAYIDRWSLWLDMKILAQTIPAAFAGR
jgi:exopolysaccharide biosynthesis polyprenyl glycosylphosphotransferase